jgi:hypothetical protein
MRFPTSGGASSGSPGRVFMRRKGRWGTSPVQISHSTVPKLHRDSCSRQESYLLHTWNDAGCVWWGVRKPLQLRASLVHIAYLSECRFCKET